MIAGRLPGISLDRLSSTTPSQCEDGCKLTLHRASCVASKQTAQICLLRNPTPGFVPAPPPHPLNPRQFPPKPVCRPSEASPPTASI
ncbi:unnamed protein product, partial [Ectocarpus sp. 6 AP-2014]